MSSYTIIASRSFGTNRAIKTNIASLALAEVAAERFLDAARDGELEPKPDYIEIWEVDFSNRTIVQDYTV